jgi:hypothetical protein
MFVSQCRIGAAPWPKSPVAIRIVEERKEFGE